MTAGLQTLSDSLSGSLSAESLQQMQQLTAGLTQLQQGIDTLNTTLQTLPCRIPALWYRR